MDSSCGVRNQNNECNLVTMFMRSLECHFGVYFFVAGQLGNIPQITFSWAHEQFATKHIIFTYLNATA